MANIVTIPILEFEYGIGGIDGYAFKCGHDNCRVRCDDGTREDPYICSGLCPAAEYIKLEKMDSDNYR